MGIKEPATSGYFQKIRVPKNRQVLGISSPLKELAFLMKEPAIISSLVPGERTP
jgi:hypothetical protein